ncbi:hypothetical protein VaNZ11_003789 [Volvox africanus]|uniref:protein O-GlcNAc transferase n=1 Tax=Volvox africanus TaxID=51714 RepID=A0ABQ5RW32_9CHLO|nr:hypothetical protein VaNZ11_003789 [Volvox africanus]
MPSSMADCTCEGCEGNQRPHRQQSPSSSLPVAAGSPPRRLSSNGAAAAEALASADQMPSGNVDGYIAGRATPVEPAAKPPCLPLGNGDNNNSCNNCIEVTQFPDTIKLSNCDRSGQCRPTELCCRSVALSCGASAAAVERAALLPQSQPLCVGGSELFEQRALPLVAAIEAAATTADAASPAQAPHAGGCSAGTLAGMVVAEALQTYPANFFVSSGRADGPPPPQRPDTPSSYETHSGATAAAAGVHGHGHSHAKESPSSVSRADRRSLSYSAQQQLYLDPQSPTLLHQQQQQIRQIFRSQNQQQLVTRNSGGSGGSNISPTEASGWPSPVAAKAAGPAASHAQSWGMQAQLQQQQLQQQQQQQHQQQQQQQQAAAMMAVTGLPLLALPTPTLPYTPWGPVLPVVHVQPAAAAPLQAPTTAGMAMPPFSPLSMVAAAPSPQAPAPAGPMPPIAATNIGLPTGPGAHHGAVLQLAVNAAAAVSVAAAVPARPASAPSLSAAAPGLSAALALGSVDSETLAGQCQLAGVLRQSGKPAEALALLDAVLLRQPSNVDSLHQRAQCQQALGQVQEAISTHLRALALVPDHTASLTALGALYQSQGVLGDAVAAYRRAHELRPDDAAIREGLAVVLTDQGTKLKNAGAPLSEAVSRYQAAVALCPNYAPALYNLGVVAGELRQGDAALEYYRAAIAAEPRYAQAHCNLGVLLRERGRLAEAVAAYQAALAAAPNFTIVRNNLAIALTDLGTHVKNEGRLDEGITLYERALSYAPRHADALYNLGVAYGEKGDLQRAAFMYEMALAFNPGCAEAHNNLGVLWKEQDNIERAVECYSAALAIRPTFPQSLNNLGVVMTAQGRAADALTLLTAAVNGSPSYTEAHNNLGVLQRDVGCIPEALASYARCLELDVHCRNAGQNRLLALNYIYPGEDPLVSSAHREWGELFQTTVQPLPPLGWESRSWDPDRPLRIGYISPDLFTHSVSYFAEAPLTHHSPARGYQHYVYSCVPKPDLKTVRLRAATEAAGGVWREVARLNEAELAELVRRDEIDLLVELTGHTANNRLGVMARRPAPVQLTWIGYPNSTGLKAVDYRLTDDVCDPWDTKQTFVEELVRLPGCFLCYSPAVDAPPVAPAPALANGYITFGSFNNLAKITPQVLRLWGAVLAAVPRSRLVLKNKPFACEAARGHVLQQLAAVGVESWRVDLLPLAPGNAEHLATYALMDISLDPFPYAGTTTTTESLFMGVPCLTMAGHCHAHNVGVSLLTALGLHRPTKHQNQLPQQQAAAPASPSSAAPSATSDRHQQRAGEAEDSSMSSSPLSPGKCAVVGAVCASGGIAAAGGLISRSGWVAHSEAEYVALAVAHASDVKTLAELRYSLRERMLASPLCNGPAFLRQLEGVYRALWRRHCFTLSGDSAAADAAAEAAGLRQPLLAAPAIAMPAKC